MTIQHTLSAHGSSVLGEMTAAVAGDVPALSFNTAITSRDDLGSPSDEALAELAGTDPKLSSPWTIWEQAVQPKDAKGVWGDATSEIVTFSTVKEFWGCWNNLPQPSDLLDGKKFKRKNGDSQVIIDSLMIFREGVKPEWEHEANAGGGHFQVQLYPKVGGAGVDEVWNNIVMGAVSGWIEESDLITGVRLVDKLGQKVKPAIRIELWFCDISDDEKVTKLRASMEKCMRTRLDGTQRPVAWDRTETKPHKK